MLPSVEMVTGPGPGHAPDRLAGACRAVSATGRDAARWAWTLRRLCADPDSTRSNLAANGDPVEFQVAWAAAGGGAHIRVTLDPRPGGTPRERLGDCLDAVADLDDYQLAGRDRLLAMIPESARRFGGWLGLRPRHGGFAGKLYLEIPEQVDWRRWPGAAGLVRLDLPVRALRPVLAGFDPARGGVEIYCEVAPVDTDALAMMLTETGLPPMSGSFLRLLSALRGQRTGPKLPTDDQGLSIAFDGAGRPLALTWYAHCDALLGPPGRARASLLELGRSAGWDMAAYAALSEAMTDGRVPWHGVAGLSVDHLAGLGVAVTCSTRGGPGPS